MKHFLSILTFIFFVGTCSSSAQKTFPFWEEVQSIQKRLDTVWDKSKPVTVFTGSSSVRLWKDLQERFPEQQLLNTGFGGSQCSDLVHFLDELILDYSPKKVFIYEGDNDIFSKKKPKDILLTFSKVLDTLQRAEPNMEIVLISAKPSISRWKFRSRYKRLNKKLQMLASERENVLYADVWSIMLNKRRLKKDLFIEDGLHMNSKGYDLWYAVLKDFVN